MPLPADEPLLYEDLAARLETMIARGALRAGHRMPSVRHLSKQEGVSASTVVQAYALLENRGAIEVRPRSGHYVRRPRGPIEAPRPARASTTSARVSIEDQVMRVYRAVRDPSIVPLGAAHPSPELLPTARLNRILASLARSSGGVGVGYDPPPGCPPFRRAIARLSIHWGAPFSAEDVVTTTGAMEALHLCLRAVTKAGDTVAVESPGYYGLLQLIGTLDLRAVEIPVHAGTGMDLDALDDALRRHRIRAVLASPNFTNPAGSLMPDDRKRDLVAMLAVRAVPLIEDDVYGDLAFDDHRPRPAKAFDCDGLVMLCGSFSKTLAPGYRAGWVAPGRFRDQVELLKFAQSIATATLPQLAVAAFLETGGYARHLRALRRRLASQVTCYRDTIAEHFPAGTRVSSPKGGFLLWVELPQGIDSSALAERALERGISIAPGTIFSPRDRFASCIRINAGHPWTPTIERAIATVGQLAAGELIRERPLGRARQLYVSTSGRAEHRTDGAIQAMRHARSMVARSIASAARRVRDSAHVGSIDDARGVRLRRRHASP